SARDSGALLSSGRLLRVEGPNRYVALSMRLPVYQPGMPLGSVEERRAAYLGSVGAGFRIRELLRGALNDATLQYMQFRLYDGGPAQSYSGGANGIGEDTLLFDSKDLLEDTGAKRPTGEGAYFKAVLPTEVAGRTWEVHFASPREGFVGDTDATLPWM